MKLEMVSSEGGGPCICDVLMVQGGSLDVGETILELARKKSLKVS